LINEIVRDTIAIIEVIGCWFLHPFIINTLTQVKVLQWRLKWKR
jgi:hypothetical protein